MGPAHERRRNTCMTVTLHSSPPLLACCAALLLCGAAHAGAATDAAESAALPPRWQLGEVLVDASRRPRGRVDLREYPGNATLVTAEEIERSGIRNLPELMRRLDGLTVMDTNGFGLGADTGVNLRGVVNGSRTGALVMLDGMRLNRVTGDEVHWQSIPVEQIDRIEVIRGGGGLGYGEGALSGVIQIHTKQGGARPIEVEQGAELGSFGQRSWYIAPRGKAGPVSYAASFTRREVGGYRESTGARTSTSLTHLAWEPAPGARIATHVHHSEDTSRFAGGITPQASQQRRRQTGSLVGFFDDDDTHLGVDAELADLAGFGLAANAFWSDRESDSATSFGRFASLTPAQGLSLRASHEAETPELRHGLVVSLDLLEEKASTGFRGGKLDESNKGSYGLWVEDTLRLWERITLVTGLRYDRARFVEDISFPSYEGTLRFKGSSPMAGLTVDLLDGLTAYGQYARPFKAPNVDDFSAVVPDQFVGNIELQPQQANDFELGLRFASATLGQARATWFFNRINDEILYNAAAFQTQNFDTQRIGVETRVEPRLPIPGLTGWIAYTFLDSEFREGQFKTNAIPGVPQHVVSAGLSYEPLRGFFCTLDWLLVQDFFRINDFNNLLPGDNYGVLNLGLRYERLGQRVFLRVDNVTNEEYASFQSSNGTAISTGDNPAPPTSVLGGVTLSF